MGALATDSGLGNGGSQQPPPSQSETVDKTISITIVWNDLNESMTVQSGSHLQSISESVTHFGVRLIYVDDNAVFTQSAEKQSAEEAGLITLEVPATELAHLYAVAVDAEEENVHLMGLMTDITIESNETYSWTVDDFEWLVPEWEVIETFEGDDDSGVIDIEIKPENNGVLEGKVTADENHSGAHYRILRYAVTDPFELLGHNGASSNVSHENGKRNVVAVESEDNIRNRAPTMALTFNPYLVVADDGP